MRKIKKFNLSQSRILSNEEMATLNGGFQLYSSCYPDYTGGKCLYNDGVSLYTGTCTFVSYYTYNGSLSTLVTGYTCVKD